MPHNSTIPEANGLIIIELHAIIEVLDYYKLGVLWSSCLREHYLPLMYT